ncbi:MAG: hypothetical protein KF696_01290 [Planctomycetes bacterium]|nr:hypothetical protein [Planctomycetota bacterium]MCW8134426.1 hypothetical protein [Planctomycetota bacterium]
MKNETQQRLGSVIRWFRSNATPDLVWLQPAEFLLEARLLWRKDFGAWFERLEPGLRKLSAAAISCVHEVQHKLGRGQLKQLHKLQRDPLCSPMPLAWLVKLKALTTTDAEEKLLEVVRAVQQAYEAQLASQWLAARALDFLLHGDEEGQSWAEFWRPRLHEKPPSADLDRAQRVCRLLDHLSLCLESEEKAPEMPESEVQRPQVVGGWLTLKQAARTIGLDERGQPLVSVSSLRKEFLAGRIAGMRARNSCNGRILLSRVGLDKWANQTAAARKIVLSPAEANLAVANSRPKSHRKGDSIGNPASAPN